jgi:hypothetical protein
LLSFTAIPSGGAILVEWETLSEVYTLGFDLYRSESTQGPLAQLNESLIPAKSAGALAGALYDWLDESVEPGTTYYYWLDVIDVSGSRTRHGPVVATALLDTLHFVYLPVVLADR